MARIYRPERVEFDVARCGPDGSVEQWLTASVEVIDDGPGLRRVVRDGRARCEASAEGLERYARRVERQLFAFATTYGAPYEQVRALVLDETGRQLMEVGWDGVRSMPYEVDSQVRRRFDVALNALPLVPRQLDRDQPLLALGALSACRGAMDALTREIVRLARMGERPLAWEEIAAAMEVPAEFIRDWYAGQDTLELPVQDAPEEPAA